MKLVSTLALEVKCRHDGEGARVVCRRGSVTDQTLCTVVRDIRLGHVNPDGSIRRLVAGCRSGAVGLDGGQRTKNRLRSLSSSDSSMDAYCIAAVRPVSEVLSSLSTTVTSRATCVFCGPRGLDPR